jgi:hypothetical protein
VLFNNEIYAENKYLFRVKYSFPIDTLAGSPVIIDRGHCWYPLIPDQVATFKLSCNVPVGYCVLAAGDLLAVNKYEESATFTWKSKSAVF